MCLDRFITFDRCAKREIRHYICIKHIEKTRFLDHTPCVDYRSEAMVLEPDDVCRCIQDRQHCRRLTWALKGDGIHSYKFEIEEGNDWAVSRGDKVKKGDKLKMKEKKLFGDDGGYATAMSIEPIRGAKKLKYNNWDQEEEEYNRTGRRNGESSYHPYGRSDPRDFKYYGGGYGDHAAELERMDDEEEARIKIEGGSNENSLFEGSEGEYEPPTESFAAFTIGNSVEPVMNEKKVKVEEKDDLDLD